MVGIEPDKVLQGMQAFTTHTGRVVAMDRANVDTDQIIPKQFLKRIERTGFGEFLFYDWRYMEDGSEKQQFELNQANARGASILLSRRNFGCGSSREHAVWALEDYGVRALIAPSFGDIFYNNCFKNGLLPIRCDESIADDLFQRVTDHPGYELTVDLEQCLVSDEHGLSFKFAVEGSRRNCLLKALDDIAATLQHADKIMAYEIAHGFRLE